MSLHTRSWFLWSYMRMLAAGWIQKEIHVKHTPFWITGSHYRFVSTPIIDFSQQPKWGTLHLQAQEGQPRERGEFAGRRGCACNERSHQICGQESADHFLEQYRLTRKWQVAKGEVGGAQLDHISSACHVCRDRVFQRWGITHPHLPSHWLRALDGHRNFNFGGIQWQSLKLILEHLPH